MSSQQTWCSFFPNTVEILKNLRKSISAVGGLKDTKNFVANWLVQKLVSRTEKEIVIQTLSS